MRRLGLLVFFLFVAGCSTVTNPIPTSISCQPYGYTPAPIAFTFAPGPVSASVAEATAVALFKSCELAGTTFADLKSSSKATTGQRGAPNDGQAVWLVQVDATVTEPLPGASYSSHFLIEVNQATGVPTVIAYG